LVFYIAFLL